jgi:3-hydroxyacyl-[acyl-carrier-protein] dehydratase
MNSFDEELQRLIKQARRELLFPQVNATKVSLGREAIGRVLRHRGPMLLLDRITAIDLVLGGIVAERQLTESDLGFEGHFPEESIYPGCLQVEMMGQLGLALRWFLTKTTNDIAINATPPKVRLIKLREAFFCEEARPGDQLTLLARCIDDNGYTITCIGQLLRGETILSGCAFEAMYTEEAS